MRRQHGTPDLEPIDEPDPGHALGRASAAVRTVRAIIAIILPASSGGGKREHRRNLERRSLALSAGGEKALERHRRRHKSTGLGFSFADSVGFIIKFSSVLP